MRPIDADALFKAVNRLFYSAFDVGSKDSENGRFRRGYNVAITDACEAITAVPTLSPDDVRCVGEWIEAAGGNYLVCPECKYDHALYDRLGYSCEHEYCPNCGKRLRMKGAED